MALNVLADTEYDDENTTTMSGEATGRDNNNPPPAMEDEDEEEEEEEEEEPWEAVDGAENAEGVLIVPPQQDGIPPRIIVDIVPQLPVPDEATHARLTELNLSDPGSVPSDVGSLERSADGRVDNVDSNQQRDPPRPRSSDGPVDNVDSNQRDPPRPRSADGRVDNVDSNQRDPPRPRSADGRVEIDSNQRDPRDDVTFQRPGPLAIRRGYLHKAVLGVLVLLTIVGLVKNHFEKLQLRRELLVAKEEAMQYKRDLELSRGPPPVCDCRNNNRGATAADEGATAIVDNCWVRANVTLGECADNAKNKVQEKLGSFQKTLQKGFRALSESWTMPRAEDDAALRDDAAQPDEGVGISLHGFSGALGVLITGVATLAVSTIADELFSHILDPKVEEPGD